MVFTIKKTQISLQIQEVKITLRRKKIKQETLDTPYSKLNVKRKS